MAQASTGTGTVRTGNLFTTTRPPSTREWPKSRTATLLPGGLVGLVCSAGTFGCMTMSAMDVAPEFCNQGAVRGRQSHHAQFKEAPKLFSLLHDFGCGLSGASQPVLYTLCIMSRSAAMRSNRGRNPQVSPSQLIVCPNLKPKPIPSSQSSMLSPWS